MKKRKGVANIGILLAMFVLVLSLFLFASVIKTFQFPHRQAAFANLELMRLSMEKACETGETIELKSFELPGPHPPEIIGILPQLSKLFMEANGDPTYVLYYESFPAGEAVGWESHIKAGNRLIANAKLEQGLKSVEASNILKNQEKDLKDAYLASSGKNSAKKIDSIAFSNIVLQDLQQPISIGTETKSFLDIIGDIGQWEYNQGYDFYSFKRYSLIPPLEKTSVKYRSCGAGNLCFKTNEGIYAFPLNSCKKRGIKYIQLAYDARGADNDRVIKLSGGVVGVAAGGALAVFAATKLNLVLTGTGLSAAFASAGVFASGIFQMTLTYKASDFYLASPCELKGNIEIEYADDCNSDQNFKCDKMTKSDIFNTENNIVAKVGEHYSCVDDIAIDEPKEKFLSEPVPCLRIRITDKKLLKNKFCFTPNAYKAVVGNPFLQGNIEKLKKESGKTGDFNFFIMSTAGAIPVTASAEFDKSNDATLIKDHETQAGLAAAWNNIIAAWKWTWPGNTI